MRGYEYINAQEWADKVSDAIEKIAIGSCIFVSIVAIVILAFVLLA